MDREFANYRPSATAAATGGAVTRPIARYQGSMASNGGMAAAQTPSPEIEEERKMPPSKAVTGAVKPRVVTFRDEAAQRVGQGGPLSRQVLGTQKQPVGGVSQSHLREEETIRDFNNATTSIMSANGKQGRYQGLASV